MKQEERAVKDRRSGKDRREHSIFSRLFLKADKSRYQEQRRLGPERRSGWVRLTKWSSVNSERYSLLKYLKGY